MLRTFEGTRNLQAQKIQEEQLQKGVDLRPDFHKAILSRVLTEGGGESKEEERFFTMGSRGESLCRAEFSFGNQVCSQQ